MERPASKTQPRTELTQHVKNTSTNRFEPHDYGNTDDPLSFFGAVIHIIKYTIHVGILALPLVHKRLGYGVGICLTLITGLVYFHIIHILIDVEYQLCKLTKKKNLTYLEVVNVGYENLSKPIRSVFGSSSKFLMHLYYGLPMSTAIGLIVMSTNVRYIARYFGIEMDIREAINVMIIPTMLLSCGISKLQMMVPYSTITNVFSLMMMCIIFGYSIFKGRPGSSSAKSINDISYIPQCFALLINSMKGTGIYIPVKNEMESPKRFSKLFGVVNITGSALTLLYTLFGAISYWSYGEALHDNVIVNLSENMGLIISIYGLYALALVVNHYLSIYVRCDIYWRSMLKPRLKDCKYSAVGEYGVKLFFNLLTYILAFCMPKYALMAAISGTMGILSDLAVAPLLQFFLMIKDWQEFNIGSLLKIIKNFLIVVMSLVLFVSSAFACVMDVIELYTEGK